MRSAGSALVVVLALAGCGAGSGDDGGASITVLAAASLTEPFEELADRFEADHPGVEVELAFDSSATLAHQALEGAPADVLATADTLTMDTAADVLDERPQVFATNTLRLVTPAGNPAGVEGIADLDSPALTWVACVETAPCGTVARELLAANGIGAEPASLEVDVKAVLAKVAGDEADAGLVYATDARAAGDAVQTFPVPYADQHRTSCAIAPLEQSGEPELARELIELVQSEEGQQLLADAGFGQP